MMHSVVKMPTRVPESRWTHLEVDSVADPIGERSIDGFIKLKEDLKSQLRRDLLSLDTQSQHVAPSSHTDCLS